MAVISTAIAVAGLGLAAGGMYMNYRGQQAQAAANQESLAAQRKAEEERKKAMELDSTRRTREMIRQQIASRSIGLSQATNQGANAEGSSAVPGVYGGASGRMGVNQLGNNQNLEIGRNIFGFNMEQSYASSRAAAAGSSAAMGAGMLSLGNGLMRNVDTISRVGTWLGSRGGDSGNGNIQIGTGPGGWIPAPYADSDYGPSY